ncbi:Rieske (2Fe-2S) protein [Janibacter sp. GS2]|uniref:Rieske (2Fe-2S) protein n=1 Tax=Janibacter sp. GS2 TaxID=3442646 RepID=UPI003EB9BEF9
MTTTRRDALGMATTAGVAAVSVTACGGGADDGGSGSTQSVRVPVTDVPQGGGLIRDDVVITQPTDGEFKAFDARCPHQGCAVGEVTASAIVCPCHGSEFDPASGAMTQGPATEGLAARTATVEGDEIVVS